MRRSAPLTYLASLLCAVLLLAYAPAAAGDARRFTVGVEDYEHFLPYSEFKAGVYGGLGKAIIDAFGKEYGYTFEYHAYPLKRRDRLFTDGKLDFAFPDNPHWVRDLKKGKKFAYAPMLDFTDGVLVRPEDKGKGVAHLKLLGIPLGFSPYPYQTLIDAGKIKVIEASAYDQLYKKIVLKHMDGAYMNVRIAEHYFSEIQKYDQAPVVFDPDLPHASDYWHFSSGKYPEVIAQFQKFMSTRQGLINQLKKAHNF
jgi:polar amino acid transport system substrate-binding protein